MLTKKKCIICGSIEGRMMYPPLDIVSCVACGFIFRDTSEAGDYSLLDKYKDFLKDKDKLLAREREAGLRFDIIAGFAKPGGRHLDIGTNEGITMQEARRRGFNTFGCEPNVYAAEYARNSGFNVINASFDEGFGRIKENGPYDLITAFHVLEHIPDPPGFLRMVKGILVPGGLLIIEVPDIDSPYSRIYKWDYMRINREHLSYFNRKSLTELLKGAGLEPVFVRRKVWDGLNQPFACNMIRLPAVAGLYSSLRALKRLVKKMLKIPELARKNYDDNSELWIGNSSRKPFYFLSKLMGNLVYYLNRGDDLMVISKVNEKA